MTGKNDTGVRNERRYWRLDTRNSAGRSVVSSRLSVAASNRQRTMDNKRSLPPAYCLLPSAVCLLLSAAILLGVLPLQAAPVPPRAQKTEPAAGKRSAPKAEPAGTPASYEQLEPGDMDSTRNTFNEILERFPRMAAVIPRDPSLLTNQEYLNNNAPELAQFLRTHPEVARNPEFFLGDRMRQVAFGEREARDPVLVRMMNDVWPFMVFVIITAALLWILRAVLENRRWSKLAKVQAEVHTKLMEKLGSSQELLTYMETEAGKRFLESAPIPVDLESQPRISAPLGRILWSAQLGLILGLAGAGMLYVRHSVPDAEQPLLVFGTLGLTFGLGFVLSAVVSYALSKHLGLFERPGASTVERAELGQAPKSFS